MWRCLNGNHVRLWVFLCCCIVLLHALYLVLAEQAPVQLHRKKRTTESCHRTLQRHSPLVACCMTTDHVCSERLLYLFLASSVPPNALGSELGPTGLMYKASKTCMASTPEQRLGGSGDAWEPALPSSRGTNCAGPLHGCTICHMALQWKCAACLTGLASRKCNI